MAHRFDICTDCHWGDGSLPEVCDSCDSGDQFEEGMETHEDDDDEDMGARFRVIPILEAA